MFVVYANCFVCLTNRSGRCYKIEAGPDLGMVHDQYIGIGLKTELSKVSVHLIERGQVWHLLKAYPSVQFGQL